MSRVMASSSCCSSGDWLNTGARYSPLSRRRHVAPEGKGQSQPPMHRGPSTKEGRLSISEFDRDLAQRPREEDGFLEAHLIRGWIRYIMVTMVNVISVKARMRGPASTEGLG